MSDTGKVYVAGHTGLVGSALVRRLQPSLGGRLLLRSRAELDLANQAAVDHFFEDQRPEQVYLAAARVGGIRDNATHPAEFIRDNVLIHSHVIDAAWRTGVRKLLYLGSSCIYPKFSPQPIKPEHLLSGYPEPTNRAYAIAKIAGIEMCRAYRAQYGFNAITIMPTNLYGPGDNFDPENSHVLPGLMRRFAAAIDQGQHEVTVWGTGRPRREFLHVDDLADALVFLMDRYDGGELINVGTGQDLSIAELAQLIVRVSGYRGVVRFDANYPDGTPRKLLDTTALSALGWRPDIPLEKGVSETWNWYRTVKGNSVFPSVVIKFPHPVVVSCHHRV